MPSTCVFQFDRENPIYFNGETIQACVILTTTKEKECREVVIEFMGRAKVRWDERKNKSSTTYSAEQIYINRHKTVHPEGKLPPGMYTYYMDITLPMEVPSSCTAEYGDIKYEISLKINRPYRFDNVYLMPITVIKNLDLNFLPELLTPLQAEDIKYLCYWPCKSGPIISTLTIPFGGYVPGQYMNYTLHIDNQSSGYDLTGICLRLLQTCTCAATDPVLKIRQKIAKMAEIVQNETVLRLSKRILEGVLLIPPVPPSSVIEHIITVDYDIEVVIKTGKYHRDSKMEVPIKIGTKPLYQAVESNHQIPNPGTEPTAPTIEPATEPLDNKHPPSYEQCSPADRLLPAYNNST